eukprot:scaffold143376_cov75-Phaeocystis_antarctica.AAC.2
MRPHACVRAEARAALALAPAQRPVLRRRCDPLSAASTLRGGGRRRTRAVERSRAKVGFELREERPVACELAVALEHVARRAQALEGEGEVHHHGVGYDHGRDAGSFGEKRCEVGLVHVCLLAVAAEVLAHAPPHHDEEIDWHPCRHSPRVRAASEKARRRLEEEGVDVLGARSTVVPVRHRRARVRAVVARRAQIHRELGIGDHAVGGLEGGGDIVVDDAREIEMVRAAVCAREGEQHHVIVALDEQVVVAQAVRVVGVVAFPLVRELGGEVARRWRHDAQPGGAGAS